MSEKESILTVRNLCKFFPIRGGIFLKKIGKVHAVDNITLTIRNGETLGLVGESGCGKSTLGRTILQLYKPTSGEVIFDGQNLEKLSEKEIRGLRRNMQIIFQDPFESLNSRHTIQNILEEPYTIHNIDPEEKKENVLNLINRVQLSQNALQKFPHEFSGGQRQRIGIARAIALKPKFIVCDEPVSALDVSIQSQILNLLLELQQEMNLTYLFIAHDLAVVRHISDRIAVMYLGKIVELTDAESIYKNPFHPYTKALISAIPVPDPTFKKNKIILEGDVPSPINPPPGCRFNTRCPFTQDICRQETPELKPAPGTSDQQHLVSCHFAGKYLG